MKKFLFLLLMTVFAVNAHAETGVGTLSLGASATSTELNIGLSPSVNAVYNTEGTTKASAQWYAVAAVHTGGNMAYGTAQDMNNMFEKVYVTGDGADTVLGTVPTEADPQAPLVQATDENGDPVVDGAGEPVMVEGTAATWLAADWGLKG